MLRLGTAPGITRITQLDARGRHRFTPSVVAHALGLVLLDNLREPEPNTGTLLDAIEQWLEPLTGLDQRADILRAATSILLAQRHEVPVSFAGALVTAWLQSQNLATEHQSELQGLAPRLVDPLLDAIEQSQRHNQAQARVGAIQTLRTLPRMTGPALDTIINRSCCWLSTGFRGVHPAESAFAEADAHRAKQFVERLGVDASGEVTVLGVQLTLVDGHPDGLAMTVPALLEGFPLEGAGRLFETAAANVAACGRLPVWHELEWLCLLNTVDTDETSRVLKTLAEDVLRRKPEGGLHPSMPKRMAAKLLWLIGTESADLEAIRINPSFAQNRINFYEDYLKNPAQSWLELERRHADSVLRDVNLSCMHRIERTKKWWIDPSFAPPPDFLEELGEQLISLSLDNVASSLWRTSEDLQFEKLVPVLARFFPQQFAEKFLYLFQQAPYCSREAQLQRAIHSIDHFLLNGTEEARIAHTLRPLLGPPQIQLNLLHISRLIVTEIQEMGAYAQREVVLSTALPAVISEISDVLTPLSVPEAEACMERYGQGNSQGLRNCIVTLADAEVGASASLRSRLRDIAFSEETDCHGVVHYILNRSGDHRWERELWQSGWASSREADYWTNHFGSLALIRAGQEASFEELAERIAPWLLPYAVRIRGENPTEVQLAIQHMGSVITGFPGDVPDLGARLTIHHLQGPDERLYFSTEPNKETNEDETASFNPDLNLQRHRRAHQTAIGRLKQVSREGADLYLSSVIPGDFVPLLKHGKVELLTWLEGMEYLTEDFCRRVRLAEGVFLALCEVLLEMDPPIGCQLWKALGSALTMRHQGITGLEERVIMLFRVPEEPEVLALREHLLTPGVARTDLDLFEVALAASLNGCEAWLNETIQTDIASKAVWQRRRGLVLQGFTTGNSVEQPDAWSEGLCDSSEASGRRKAGRRRYYEGGARHWWAKYLAATDPVEAFAAWRLFLACADRRAWQFVFKSMPERTNYQNLDRKKRLNLELNLQTLAHQMKEHEERLEKTFLGEELPTTLGAWGKF